MKALYYRKDIDGLRGIAVLSVILYHSFPRFFQAGFVGVDIFFVISGFLISSIIFKNIDNNSFSLKDFYYRRIKRIFPAYILVISISYLISWFILFPGEFKTLGKHILSSSIFAINFELINDFGYFDSSAETKPLLHLWSLSIEEQFYIVYPFFLIILYKKKNSLIIIFSFFLVSFFLNVFLLKKFPIQVFYLPFTRIWELMMGGLIAYFGYFRSQIINKFDNNLTSIVGILLIVIGFLLISKEPNFPGILALFPVLGSGLIMLVNDERFVNKKILSNSILVWFGLISYPLYLWHWVLLVFARIVESDTPDRFIRLFLILISIFLAFLTYRYIERHLRFENYFKRKYIFVYILISINILLGFVGLLTYKFDGFKNRDSIKNYQDPEEQLFLDIENNCSDFFKSKKIFFTYCKFSDTGSKKTVAIIGDSHALTAYYGLNYYLNEKKINTLLMANSGCPPLFSHPVGDAKSNDECSKRINQIIEILQEDKNINDIYILTRGPYYLTGTEPISSNFKHLKKIISVENFIDGLQNTINKIFLPNRNIYYITENPELSYSAKSCVVRPARITKKDCRPYKNEVLIRQNIYLENLKKLYNVEVINNLNFFCPTDRCVISQDNNLFYSDDDHLSRSGSLFQARKILEKYSQQHIPL